MAVAVIMGRQPVNHQDPNKPPPPPPTPAQILAEVEPPAMGRTTDVEAHSLRQLT